MILALLCDPGKTAELDRILLQGLTARQPGLAIEHDGISPDGSPVLFGYFCDLPRIARFNTSLELSERPGTLICFDFQAEVLRSYCGSRVRFQTIDFTKFEGVVPINKKKLIVSLIAAPFAILAILYAGGFLAQLLGNYATWKQGGGIPGDGTSPLAASPDFLLCLSSVLRPPYGVYGILICIGLLAVLLIMVMRMGYGDAGEYDEDRNFSYSAKGTYGTSGWMSRKEMSGVLDLVPDLRKHKGIVLGMLDGKAVCIPEDTRINSNLAVYGASGSMKTRSFCMNRILQATVRGENGAGESLIICDPKSELYEKSSEFLRSRGYCVKVFNLVSPENSDSWCCLAEVEGQELMAQLFVDVIIKNTTNNGKSDHFWDACEMNLLKALVLYVDQGYAEENRNIGEVYRLLTLNGESQLDTLLEALPSTHPAKAPYSLFKQASDTVRSGVIIGLGSRLQVFQSELIKKITAKNEIDLELPGQQPCAYFLVTSDQDSTFDFLASLFLSFCFIKLVRYADHNCEGGKLPVPVHILGEELTACGTIRPLPPAQRNTLPEYLHVLCVPKSSRIAEQIPTEFVAGDHWKL